jgi:hypothetical protein
MVAGTDGMAADCVDGYGSGQAGLGIEWTTTKA